jgi:hypothetical protein
VYTKGSQQSALKLLIGNLSVTADGFNLDPDPEKIIPDPVRSKKSGFDRIWIYHNINIIHDSVKLKGAQA